MKNIRRYWGVGVISAVWLLFTLPFVLHGLVPFPSKYLVTFFPPWSASYGMAVKNNAMPDVITQIYPWKRVTIASWKHGEVPLWNPYSFSGTAHAGNYQSAVFSPSNLLFFLLPEVQAWSIMILLQPFLAGIFMYLFLRSMRVSREGSVIGSVAFMFCGFMTVWMAYGTLGYAALYLPLSLFAVNRHMRGDRWGASLYAVSIGLSFLSGHFQISMYVLSFAVLYVLYVYVSTKEKPRAAVLFPATLAGVSLAAFQILPSLSAYVSSVRSSLFIKGEIIPWSYIVTLFAPDFYGNPVTRNDWFGHYAEWASFVGVAPLILASIALWHRRFDSVVRFFGGVALFCILLAFPTPLNDLMYALHIPVFSTSSASRIIVLVSFSLAVLSGIGVDALVDLWKKPGRRKGTPAAAVVVLLVGFWIWLKFMHPLPADKLAIAIRNSYIPTIMGIATCMVVFAGRALPKQWKKIGAYMLVILTAADLLRYSSKWMPFDPQEYVYPQERVLSFVSSVAEKTYSRVFGNIGAEAGAAFGIPLIEGYDAVYQGRYGEFIRAAITGELIEPERSVVQLSNDGVYAEEVLRLLGVQFLVHRISDGRFGWAYPFWDFPGYHLLWKDDVYEVFENKNAYPRVFLASSYTVETEDKRILSTLFAKDFNRRDSLVLEEEPMIQPASGSGTAAITKYTPNQVSIAVATQVPTLLFLSDVYDAGWHAAVDGVHVPLYRADYDFRAVGVSQGIHTVTMWYWPPYMTLGFGIAGFATLWCVGMLLRRGSS